jgi:hypothetical protein
VLSISRGTMGKEPIADETLRFGLLRVISDAPSHKTPNGTVFRKVLCECDCGTKKTIRWSELTRKGPKKTVSCGCFRDRNNRARRPPSIVVHGLCSRKYCHYLYNTWKNMKGRCLSVTSRNYYLYGGRGIKLDKLWENDPGAFASYVLAHLGERPSPEFSIDRVNNNGNYEPGNLRWATRAQQVANRRPSSEWLPWGTRTGRRLR